MITIIKKFVTSSGKEFDSEEAALKEEKNEIIEKIVNDVPDELINDVLSILEKKNNQKLLLTKFAMFNNKKVSDKKEKVSDKKEKVSDKKEKVSDRKVSKKKRNKGLILGEDARRYKQAQIDNNEERKKCKEMGLKINKIKKIRKQKNVPVDMLLINLVEEQTKELILKIQIREIKNRRKENGICARCGKCYSMAHVYNMALEHIIKGELDWCLPEQWEDEKIAVDCLECEINRIISFDPEDYEKAKRDPVYNMKRLEKLSNIKRIFDLSPAKNLTGSPTPKELLKVKFEKE